MCLLPVDELVKTKLIIIVVFTLCISLYYILNRQYELHMKQNAMTY